MQRHLHGPENLILLKWQCESASCSVVSDSATPEIVAHQAPHPWDSAGKDTGVGCHVLQGIFPTQGLNSGLPHCRQILYLSDVKPKMATPLRLIYRLSCRPKSKLTSL